MTNNFSLHRYIRAADSYRRYCYPQKKIGGHHWSHFLQDIRGRRHIVVIYRATEPAIETEVDIEKCDHHYQPYGMHQMQVGLRICKPPESEKELVIARSYKDADEHTAVITSRKKFRHRLRGCRYIVCIYQATGAAANATTIITLWFR